MKFKKSTNPVLKWRAYSIYKLEIKTFSFVLEFKMSFQQQQLFILLYSDLGGSYVSY